MLRGRQGCRQWDRVRLGVRVSLVEHEGSEEAGLGKMIRVWAWVC